MLVMNKRTMVDFENEKQICSRPRSLLTIVIPKEPKLPLKVTWKKEILSQKWNGIAGDQNR